MARSDGSVIIDTRLNTAGFGKGVNSIKSQFTKMGAAASKVGGAITSVFTRGTKSAKGFNSQLNAVGTMAKKVGGLIATAFSIRAIVDFAKEALELGSDLQEVQNVVDVTFTTMNDRVNEFAKNAASTAGLSETMAKRYAGTFGAMAKSFQFTEEEAFNMSTALTQLAGDVASFYNITQDEAYTKLKSVFTGETETLKDLGVVMTQTALDDFALRKGLGKTTSEMTEQEKVALRYQFVLEQLSAASGDFIRTQDGWANQTRILSLQFEQLKATIGQGLINALTPAIKSLNLLILKLQEAAEGFRDFTEAVFGSAGDTNGAISGVTDNTEDLSDAIEEAGKKAKKALAPFDEIVKISAEASAEDPSVTIPGTDGVSGGTVAPEVDAGDVGPTIIEQIAESIKNGDWASIGTLINDGITTALDGINWDEAAAKVSEGAQKVTDAINGLMFSPDAFSSIGTSFGEALNTISTAIQTFSDNINWEVLREGISAGLLSAAEAFNAGAAVDALVSVIGNAYSAINFSDVGAAIATTLNNATENADWTKVGETIATVLLALPETVVGLIQGLNWEKVGKAVSDTLNAALATTTAWVRETDWLKVGESVQAFIEATDWTGIASSLHGLFTAAVEALDLANLGKSIIDNLNFVIENAEWGTVGATVADLFNDVIGDLDNVLVEFDWGGLVSGLIKELNSIVNGVDWALLGQTVSDGALTILSGLRTAITEFDWIGLGDGIAESINQIDWAEIVGEISGFVSDTVIAALDLLIGFAEELDWAKLGTDLWNGLVELVTNIDWGGIISRAFELLGSAAAGAKSLYASFWANVATALSQALVDTGSYFQSFIDKEGGNIGAGILSAIDNAFVNIDSWVEKNLWTPFKKGFENTFSGTGNALKKIFEGIPNVLKSPINSIIGFINSMVSAVCDGINLMIDALNAISVEIPDWSWLPKDVRGAKIGFDIDRITAPKIPYLAQGAVIPPNAPFMAVLGDQRHGTNIEAPLSTIQEAVALVMEDYAATNIAGFEAIVAVLKDILEAVYGIHIGDDVIAQAVDRYNRRMNTARGGA